MKDYPIKLAAEKNLNKYTFPIVSIKGKEIKEYPIKHQWKVIKFVCANGIYGAEERMIGDILGTIQLLKTNNRKADTALDFSNRIPTSNDSRVKDISGMYISEKLLKYFVERVFNAETDVIHPGYFGMDNRYIPIEVDGKNERMKTPRKLCFADTELKQQLPFLQKYSSKRIFEIIKRTSECRFRMIYPIRYFNGEEYKNFPYASGICPSRLFNNLKVEASKVSKDNKILERRYEMTFDTILGYFFMQNVLSCYTDLIPGHFYLMSSYAQLFYRLLILPYYGGVKIPISLEEIKTRLVLKSENYMSRKTVRRILDELESNRLISSPNEIIKDNSYWYQYEKSSWGTINDTT